MTIPKFQKYVCIGDSVAWSAEGFDITARVEYDYDTRPADFELCDYEQIKAWRNNEWFFGGIVLSVSRNGVELTDHAASLWGVYCNMGEDNDYLSEVCEDLQDEAIDIAREEVRRILTVPGE